MLAKYLDKEESTIRKNVLAMGYKSSNAIDKAISCYKHLDVTMAEDIIKSDNEINYLQKEVEASCIQVIARQQPVAHDLRELLADMNIAKELERIADYAVSIAKIVLKLPSNEQDLEPEIIEMATKCVAMLNEIMVDYAEEDAKNATSVALKDDEIDVLEHNLNDKVFKLMQDYPDNAVCYTYQLWIIHQLERIGDRVTNIAESVVFQSTGKVVNFD
ncbi:MAG: phosphate signaling complex protein PhoU [Pseudomonadota bacterium]